ncbi:MAG: hypothetical protein GY774_04200 [Planctomycetes bacterium]|nr:hypothetical protein [Planctomycetota bacterium]
MTGSFRCRELVQPVSVWTLVLDGINGQTQHYFADDLSYYVVEISFIRQHSKKKSKKEKVDLAISRVDVVSLHKPRILLQE